MNTLHEFFMQTETISYLIAVLFLVSFAYLYRFVFGGRETKGS
jgi:hypothetical protein